jgi:parallel beta-helix repeat protein
MFFLYRLALICTNEELHWFNIGKTALDIKDFYHINIIIIIERQMNIKNFTFIITHGRSKYFRCFAMLLFLNSMVSNAIAAPIEYYVSPTGDDTNNVGTVNSPFASISKARDAIRLINSSMTDDIYVYVMGGSYYLDEAIVFNSNDSATNGYQIYYTNYQAEEPVIYGGKLVTNWVADVGSVMKADVGVGTKFWSLLVDEKLAQNAIAEAAEWQAISSFDLTNVRGFYKGNWMSEYLKTASRSGNTITATVSKSNWTGSLNRLEGARDFLNTAGEWALDSNTGFLYYHGSNVSNIVMPTTYKIFDFQGESITNRVENIVIDGLQLKLADAAETIRAYSGITVNGWKYHNLDSDETIGSAAISISNAEYISVRNMNISEMPLIGVALNNYAKNNEVANYSIKNIGYAGVYLRGHRVDATMTDYNRNNIVHSNEISDIGFLLNHAVGVALYQSGYNQITNNVIYNSRRYGISLKGVRYGEMRTIGLGAVTFDDRLDSYIFTRSNTIEKNLIYATGTDSGDGGGIEAWGAGKDNVINNNILYDIYKGIATTGWRGHSIFLDDSSDYWTVTNNIVYSTLAPNGNASVMSKGVQNIFENNVFDIGYFANGAGNLQQYIEPASDSQFNKNIIYSDTDGSIGNDGNLNANGSSDRTYLTLTDEQSFTSIDHNLYFVKNGNGTFIAKESGSNTHKDFSQWLQYRNGDFDQNSFEGQDPQFIDALNRDYRLSNDSPALSLGITSIDTSIVGPSANFKYSDQTDPLKFVYLMADQNDISVDLPLGDTQLNLSARTEKQYVADLSLASDIFYSSSDTSVAIVDYNGLVTLLSEDQVTITASVTINGVTKNDTIVINDTVTDGGESNIALTGTATQSSTIFSGVASRAIDGNTNGLWSQNSVTHTAGAVGDWWQVELNDEYDITSINIYNRSGCCSARLSGYTVSILDASDNTIWSSIQDSEAGRPTTIAVTDVTRGVKVIVTQNLAKPLSLAEVEIIGTASTPLPTLLEAENATKFGRAREFNDSAASGDLAVQYLELLGDGIEFENVPASTSLIVNC